MMLKSAKKRVNQLSTRRRIIQTETVSNKWDSDRHSGHATPNSTSYTETPLFLPLRMQDGDRKRRGKCWCAKRCKKRSRETTKMRLGWYVVTKQRECSV